MYIPMLDPVAVGRAVAFYRNQKGISQEVLSGLADIGRSHLSAIERGERKPTLETLYRISRALDIKMSTIIIKLEEELEKNGYTVRHVEGYRSGRWILIDAGDVVTHVFVDQDRSYYELENPWCDAPRIPFEGE